MIKFIFDVDGTLTPSRSQMDLEFRSFFNTFTLVNDVYLVTGSDKPKTVEQVTEHTFNMCKKVYNCSGAEVWAGNNLVEKSIWKAPKELYDIMNGWLEGSNFPLRTGTHIEERSGMINFSVLGRNCTQEQRAEYVKWDEKNRERETIAYIINSNLKNVTATVGGETGIDIGPTGTDKSQILKDFNKDEDFIYFFGDRMEKGGNDYPLANKLKKDGWKCANVSVKDWKDTWNNLKDLT